MTLGSKPRFASNAEFFAALEDLIDQLKAGSEHAAASELETGMRCLNGLTDGWALLLESINKVVAARIDHLTDTQRTLLEEMRHAVDTAVHRR